MSLQDRLFERVDRAIGDSRALQASLRDAQRRAQINSSRVAMTIEQVRLAASAGAGKSKLGPAASAPAAEPARSQSCFEQGVRNKKSA